MKKEERYFNHAYKSWCGEDWIWKKEDGKHNHPMDSNDPEVKAFYIGFRFAAKGQRELFDKLKRVKYLKDQIKDVEKQIMNYKKGKD